MTDKVLQLIDQKSLFKMIKYREIKKHDTTKDAKLSENCKEIEKLFQILKETGATTVISQSWLTCIGIRT